MGNWYSGPNYEGFLSTVWGLGGDEIAACLSSVSGIVIGPNPPYNVADFFGTFGLKFAGTPTAVAGDLTGGSPVVSNTATDALSIGLMVTGPLIPPGTVIQSIDSSSRYTMSKPAASDQVESQVNVFTATVVPAVVVNAYIAVASASIMQGKWRELWPMAMALYVAHFLTLFLQSDGVVTSNPGQIAAAGLARGILVSKGGGPVSGGYQMTPGLEDWGQWNETQYGKQLATFAKTIGMGPILVI